VVHITDYDDSLELWQCQQLQVVTIDTLTTRQTAAQMQLFQTHYHPHLQSIKLVQDSSDDGIEDETMQRLVRGCPKLWRMSLRYWSGMAGIQSDSLRYLSMKGCEWIENEDLISIATHCPNLSELIMEQQPYLTDSAFEKLGKISRKLVRLKLVDVEKPSFGTLSSATLRQITLYFCNSITNNSILQLVQNCEKLEEFHLVFSKEVDEGDDDVEEGTQEDSNPVAMVQVSSVVVDQMKTIKPTLYVEYKEF
jgi:hypothetical protein